MLISNPLKEPDLTGGTQGSLNDDRVSSTATVGETSSDSSAKDGKLEETLEPTDQPKFYKKDMLVILEEKNRCKEQADNFKEELEEWKR